MDTSSVPSIHWLPELAYMEDPDFMNQFFDEYKDQNVESVLDGNFYSLSSDSCNSSIIDLENNINSYFDGKTGIHQPVKSLKTESSNSSTTTENLWTTTPDASPAGSPPPSSRIISFGCSGNPSVLDLYGGTNNIPVDGIMKSKDEYLLPRNMKRQQNYVKKAGKGTKRPNPDTDTNSPSYDHIMAERRRREKLSQRFIALSALVPNLTKLDKASVLGDAIKYLKQLEEKVKILEEQTTKKTVESVVFVNKRSRVTADDDIISSYFDDQYVNSLPEVEVKVSNKNVLIRIHCEKHKGSLVKILAEIEKYHLTVVNSNVMVFGDSALDITIHAKLDEKFCMEIKDFVRNLRSEFLRFMQD
ncbi:hypothetical protein C5167_016285 [Papaver somniferum]|uniref:transcription factor bHLH18-like isoform X1 n=2 Tax=Papaver somniferum TaxID=3469 RepID=UPI000E6F9725|nr:transcription factor bHLH18-like isoform X1 [Papaver somniferum]RZC88483.1 hypothetical protein C5167_016285 [Papaver somniferum]